MLLLLRLTWVPAAFYCLHNLKQTKKLDKHPLNKTATCKEEKRKLFHPVIDPHKLDWAGACGAQGSGPYTLLLLQLPVVSPRERKTSFSSTSQHLICLFVSLLSLLGFNDVTPGPSELGLSVSRCLSLLFVTVNTRCEAAPPSGDARRCGLVKHCITSDCLTYGIIPSCRTHGQA